MAGFQLSTEACAAQLSRLALRLMQIWPEYSTRERVRWRPRESRVVDGPRDAQTRQVGVARGGAAEESQPPRGHPRVVAAADFNDELG